MNSRDPINETPLCTSLWLGPQAHSPFKTDRSLLTGTRHYNSNSAQDDWPTFARTTAHRLHDITTLCDACDRMDITKLAEGGPPVRLRDSYFEIADTAGHCRFCSLLAQSCRGVHHYPGQSDFLYIMARDDAVDDGPVDLHIRDGRLHVQVPFPEAFRRTVQLDDWVPKPGGWTRDTDGWVFGRFEFRFGEGAAVRDCDPSNGELANKKVDISLDPGKDALPPGDQTPEASMERRLAAELQRVINPTICEVCASHRPVFGSTSSGPTLRTATPPTLPHRVVQIVGPTASGSLALRLMTTDGIEKGRYVALSHRWGGVLTLKTNKNTLADRTLGFQLDAMPRTFQDAVHVARAMHIEYVWIDSLCIVEDDYDEWLKQSAKMGSIYMNATFVIAAHSAEQCNEGFLWRSHVPSALHIAPSLGGPDFSVSIPDLATDQLRRRFFESEIMRRAWVLQELTLSPKIMHFVENHVFWECEHYSLPIQTPTLETSARIFRKGAAVSGTHTAWLELVQRYSGYKMTKSGDKLVALAGVVGVLQDMMENPDDKSYHCGVFQTDVERSLLWYNTADEPCLDIERRMERAPSWTWASVDASIQFLSLEPPRATSRSLMRIKSRNHQDYLDRSIGHPHCRLVIEAPVIHITGCMVQEKRKYIRNRPPKAPFIMVAIWKEWIRNEAYGWCIPDENSALPAPVSRFGPGEPASLCFLAVWGRVSEGVLVGAWCVMIKPVEGSPGLYQRVGMGYVNDRGSISSALASPVVVTLG